MSASKLRFAESKLFYAALAHALRFRRVAVALQAHMPAVHPEMTIWGVKGGSPPSFLG